MPYRLGKANQDSHSTMRVLISLPQSVCTVFIEYTEKRGNGRLKSTNLNGIKYLECPKYDKYI